jgi:hypothetical protein
MLEAVARDLVSAGGDLAHQPGGGARRFGQDEKGAAPAVRGERLEHPPRRLADARRGMEIGRRRPAVIVHVEPVLDVDREDRLPPRGERPGRQRRARGHGALA